MVFAVPDDPHREAFFILPTYAPFKAEKDQAQANKSEQGQARPNDRRTKRAVFYGCSEAGERKGEAIFNR